MDQTPLGQRGPAAEILRLIQRHGPQEIKALEAMLGVSANAVREQLQQLQQTGLVAAAKLRRGAGRPAHVYSLTEKAQLLFGQGYDLLLKLLLDEIILRDGAEHAQTLLNAVGARLADDVTHGARVNDLRAQVQRVIEALDQRGVPIALHEAEEGVALREWTCPYLSLAREHPGICEMEQQMLERALHAQVTIAERMIDGHAGCRFVVKPRQEIPATETAGS